MPKFIMPNEVTSLPQDQQRAINQVLVNSGLLTSSGDPVTFTPQNLPAKNKQNLKALGADEHHFDLFINFKCIAARAAEVAAVAACASVPGGQIAIAACVAAAHVLADEACK